MPNSTSVTPTPPQIVAPIDGIIGNRSQLTNRPVVQAGTQLMVGDAVSRR